jgi:small subunit ribosomal protein S16
LSIRGIVDSLTCQPEAVHLVKSANQQINKSANGGLWKGNSMLVIRLSRTGSKKQAHYRVVVCEKKQATTSRVVEIVGHYNPRTKPATVVVEQERIDHWIKQGARPSQTIKTLLARHLTTTPAVAPEATAQ